MACLRRNTETLQAQHLDECIAASADDKARAIKIKSATERTPEENV